MDYELKREYYHKKSKLRVEPTSQIFMYITQITPLEAEAGYYHKNSKIRVEPTSQVSMYITQITPWKTGTTKVKGLDAEAGILLKKFKISRGTNESGFHVYHTNHPPWKTGTTKVK